MCFLCFVLNKIWVYKISNLIVFYASGQVGGSSAQAKVVDLFEYLQSNLFLSVYFLFFTILVDASNYLQHSAVCCTSACAAVLARV